MFENVDGWTDGRRMPDAGVTGILIAHLRAFGLGELINHIDWFTIYVQTAILIELSSTLNCV